MSNSLTNNSLTPALGRRKNYAYELVLDEGQKRYYERLYKHNWRYFLSNSNLEYTAAKKVEAKLKETADKKGGNYKILFDRFKDDHMR